MKQTWQKGPGPSRGVNMGKVDLEIELAMFGFENIKLVTMDKQRQKH